MTHATTTLDFTDIQLKTNTLIIETTVLLREMHKAGIPTTDLVPGLDYDPVSIEDAQRALHSVRFALDLIGQTPNACINHEALAAFDRTVDHVAAGLKEDWIQAILNKHLRGGSLIQR